MAEYLSPGVYVEEFESGMQPMEGMSTSTAGFIGMAEKGPVRRHAETNRPVAPVLLTSFADYRRIFGGHLSEKIYGDNRFLPHAVEQFFANGGSLCYVMRVAPEGATIATSKPVNSGSANTLATAATVATFATSDESSAIVFRTKKSETVSVTAKEIDTAKAEIVNFVAGKTHTFNNVAGFEEGDIVKIVPTEKDKGTVYNRITSISDKSMTFVNDIAHYGIVQCCRLDVTILQDGKQVKTVQASLNSGKPSYIKNVLKDVVDVNDDAKKLGEILNRDCKSLPVYFKEATNGELKGKAEEVTVTLKNGKTGTGTETVTAAEAPSPLLVFQAKNEGTWGDGITVTARQTDCARTEIRNGSFEQGVTHTLKSTDGFEEGDIVKIVAGENTEYNRIKTINGSTVTFEKEITQDSPIQCCRLTITIKSSSDGQSESYEDVSLNPGNASYVKNVLAKSTLVDVVTTNGGEKTEPDLITATFNNCSCKLGLLLCAFKESCGTGKEVPIPNRPDFLVEVSLNNGSNGVIPCADTIAGMYTGDDSARPGERTGLAAFAGVSNVSIMAIPGITSPAVQVKLVAHCENEQSRFAILDMPCEKVAISELEEVREPFDTNYAAMYHPWIQVFDPSAKKQTFLPPSGFVAGIYARSDSTRGVHKAPANEVVQNALGLSCHYGKGEQDVLNPKGINVIRALPGQGIRVWGARTCSSNPLWKYVNVRRLFIFLEESIKASINWAVFEPNDDVLWTRVRLTIASFLRDQYRAGALVGATEEQAFYVKIGPETMSPQDILNGRLICEIGVAPSRPAEFVIFRITQMTGGE
jgi:phage tail sheath protein FI